MFYKLIKIIKITLAATSGILLVLGIVGFWMASQAQRNAKMMESCQWINNDRCLAKVANPTDLNQSFRFAVFGDVQIGVAQLPRLMKALQAYAPVAFIVQTGDAVAHADSGHYNFFLNELAHSGLWLPMFVVPGDHDVHKDNEQLFERYFGPKYLWFKYGEALFIVLNNAESPLDEMEYRWLQTVLQKQKKDTRHIFLFMHAQPIHWNGDGKKPVEHHYKRLFELLKRYGIDYVFAGNWHGYHREERNGTVFVINGRGGDYDSDEKLVPCYFTVVEVKKDSVQDQCIELPPRVGIVVQSRFKDNMIAHVGEFARENPWYFSGVLLVLGLSSAFFIIWLKKANMSGYLNLEEQERETKGA